MQDVVSNQIIGLIRFSYPSLDGFRNTHASLEETEKFLYDPARLEQRFKLFEQFTLPSLVAQTDQDYILLVLTGETLPKEYADRLADILSPLSNVRILKRPSLPHFRALNQSFKNISSDGFTHRTTFRLDDDDAIDHQYIQRIRTYSDFFINQSTLKLPIAFAFNRGLYVDFTKEEPEIFDATERSPLVGPVLVAPIDDGHNIYRRNHRKLAQFYNTYTECDTISYIRTIHPLNDSNPYYSGIIKSMTDEEIDEALLKGFGLKRSDICLN